MKNFKLSKKSFNQKTLLALFSCFLLALQSCIILEFLAPSSGTAGSEIPVTVKVQNNLSNSIDGVVSFYLSYDRFLENSDISLGGKYYPELQSGEIINLSETLTIPSHLNFGSYYLIAATPYSEFAREFQITDNVMEGKDVVPTNVLWADDLQQEIRNQKALVRGRSHSFYYEVKNSGTQTAVNVQMRYYLSPSTSFAHATAIQVGHHSGVTLSPGSNKNLEGYITIDENLPNTYTYLIIRADSEESIVEFNENNNTIAKRIRVIAPGAGIINTTPTDQLSDNPDAAEIQIEQEITNTDVNLFLPKTIELFPNPTQEKVQLAFELPQPTDIDIDIMDVNGNVIHTISRIQQEGFFREELDLQPFPTGIYLVHVMVEDQVFTKKLVIQK